MNRLEAIGVSKEPKPMKPYQWLELAEIYNKKYNDLLKAS